jgi:hypothetical protein
MSLNGHVVVRAQKKTGRKGVMTMDGNEYMSRVRRLGLGRFNRMLLRHSSSQDGEPSSCILLSMHDGKHQL